MSDYEIYTSIYLKSFLCLEVFWETEKAIIYSFTALINFK